ncbi:efflux RND transporter periplasmic adaptor subunit [uncultured Salipiger sp.]|uniref:efflux RND transporter periplasmic adaptor subunit n=1 Tax=uncultured Salipiger sp. TaxID=499810 RepID=UPI0025998D5A|nr:efflux RND transporter periplasmic adaptor subunit [uncultured Salipiger sp.]
MKLSKATVAISIVLLCAGAGWQWFKDTQETAPAAPRTVAVTRGTVESTVLATGLIEAESLVSVGARTSGLVEELLVDIGDDVVKGELIARIDSLEQQNAVQQAKADLAQLDAEIASNAAEIRLAEQALSRQQTLITRELVTTEDLESAEATLDMARANAASLQAQRARAEIEVATAELDLERTQITAPIDGTVVAVVSDEGTTVNNSSETPTIVKLAQLDRMKIKAEISEADVVNVAPGQLVRFSLLGAPDRVYEAELASVEPAPSSIRDSDEIDTDSAIYYNARFVVDNSDRLLRIGMSTNVTIILGRSEDTLTLPLATLPSAGPEGRYVVSVLADGDRPERRVIEIGLKDATSYEVLTGLEEGDRVIGAGARPPAAFAAQIRSSRGPGGPPRGMF